MPATIAASGEGRGDWIRKALLSAVGSDKPEKRMNSFLLAFSPLSGMEAFSLLWAGIGGLVVLLGLCVEKLAEILNEKFLAPPLKPHAKLESIGWCILMAGICIETADAVCTAYEINNASPKNQPAADISAILRLDVKGTNFSLTLPDPARHVSLQLIDNVNSPSSGLGFVASDVRPIAHYTNFATHEPIFWEYIFEFRHPYMPAFDWLDIHNTNEWEPPLPTVKEALTTFRAMRIYVDFVPNDAEILKGDAKLFVNGIQKNFKITGTKTDKNLSSWNPGSKGIFLYATNSTP